MFKLSRFYMLVNRILFLTGSASQHSELENGVSDF